MIELTVEPSVDEHGAVEHDRRVAEPGQVGAQILGNAGLDVVPAVAQDVVHNHVRGITFCTLRPV